LAREQCSRVFLVGCGDAVSELRIFSVVSKLYIVK